MAAISCTVHLLEGVDKVSAIYVSSLGTMSQFRTENVLINENLKKKMILYKRLIFIEINFLDFLKKFKDLMKNLKFKYLFIKVNFSI